METSNWSNFCRELAGKIINYKNKKDELIKILKASVDEVGAFKKNFSIIEKNQTIEPFTFMAMPLTVRVDKRKKVFEVWKKKFEMNENLPDDFAGMPQLNPLKAGFYGDIDLLWRLFELAHKYPQLSQEETAEFGINFDKAIAFKNVGISKLTIVFFVINTNLLSCDQNTLQKLGVTTIKDADSYIAAIEEATKKNINFLDASIGGYQEKTEKKALKQKLNGFKDYLLNNNISNSDEYIDGLVSLMEEIKLDLLEKNNRSTIWNSLEQGKFNEQYGTNKKKSTLSKIKKYLGEFIAYKNKDEEERNDADMPTSNRENQVPQENNSNVDKKCPLNQILYGPPGTGKTYNTIDKAVEIIDPNFNGTHEDAKKKFKEYKGNGQIEFVTFHQSYGYEEFIQGIKPAVADNGQVVYKVEDGIFKAFCDNAKGDENNYVFIIDEINRGNVSKIFGELITLIEESKRIGAKEEMQAVLPYRDENNEKVLFGVPNNVYILGTMNTADRSLVQLDAALRRRFRFIEMMPDYTLLEEDAEGIDVRSLLKEINKKIREMVDREHQIGHSYLIGVKTKEKLEEVFKNEIIPLLQEYFYEDYENIKVVLGGQEFTNEEQKIDLTNFSFNRIYGEEEQ